MRELPNTWECNKENFEKERHLFPIQKTFKWKSWQDLSIYQVSQWVRYWKVCVNLKVWDKICEGMNSNEIQYCLLKWMTVNQSWNLQMFCNRFRINEAW